MTNRLKFLVIVDYQNDFVTGPLGSEAAVEIGDRIVEKVKTWDGDIIVTKDTHFEDYFDTQEGKKLPVKHCIANQEGWELVKELQEALDEKKGPCHIWEVIKDTFGSYAGFPAKFPYTETKGKEFDITIIGVCTDICVVSNAILLKAVYPEAEITVDSSCCAGTSVERHNAALEVMKSCQVNII